MALRRCKPSTDTSSPSRVPLSISKKGTEKVKPVELSMAAGFPVESDVDIDLKEVYFLIMHFLSVGPCKRTYGQFWNELLEHQLLPRRYHAWYSRSGTRSGDEDDDGMSLPLGYLNLAERYPQIEKDHLIKLLKQLISSSSPPLHGVGGSPPNAADVPTLLGSGSFSLLGSVRNTQDKRDDQLPGYLRWPHMQADQVRGLSLREIGGGFAKHHRAPSVRAACYAIAKPSTMVQKMQIIKKLRGHQNAVYCATFDRSGRYVITGSDDRLVKIWSMETAFCLASCRGHEGDITDLAVSSNNAVVASSSNDFVIRVWHIPNGLPISVLRGHSGAVTAIAFSPRPNAAFQLLSSSDDGTCRIWDARYSHINPKIYIPKPPDAVAGKSNGPTPNIGQRNQILCCAFNANGTVFVTGSSDTCARVWNACRSNTEDPELPNHEMDILSGHENDVNYVQFSGCAVPSRSSTVDTLKEDNLPKFKNSWFTHDNIVTCSRDGSAIIWIPRSRRSHGKVGRWTRAYHLKVPPPPMPPQPPRGGPRQRYQPTPRGVNMIVWSLDNRFVLAAIMDCRICVWNASDGSLVHSLMGHSESTFVLDVHPFNPRIAMSAGYDGKTIIWDIWEGTPVQIYETGRFKLVDGKFSPDGTSIVLSDEVGQIFIIATGQGESQKDAQYDQFFLGDYRPLIQDTHGNILDQETQLTTYRRNMQDLLCDSSMIPYPEPYQSMYQQRRLGALGIEWCPPSVKFAIGPTYNSTTGEYQMLPVVDVEGWLEPLPEFVDPIDWEQENEMQSDDTDSEYNVTDEFSSEGEPVNLSGSNSSGDPGCSSDDSRADHDNKELLRRSKRKKKMSDMEMITSSGRRIKRRNFDEHDATTSRTHKSRGLRNGRKKSSASKSSRPQRRAARNALSLFSKIKGGSTDAEDEDEAESCSSESESIIPESNSQSLESERSMLNNQLKHVRENEASKDESQGVASLSQPTDGLSNAGSKKRLILKLPIRDPTSIVSSGNLHPGCHEQNGFMNSLVKVNPRENNLFRIHSTPFEPGQSSGTAVDPMPLKGIGCEVREASFAEASNQPNLPTYNGRTIKWGEVKLRSSKRLKLSDNPVTDAWHTHKTYLNGIARNVVNGHPKTEDEFGMSSNCVNRAQGGDLEKEENGNSVQFGDGALQGLDGVRNKVLVPETICDSLELCPSANTGKPDQIVSPVTVNGVLTETMSHMNNADKDRHGIAECRGTDEAQKGFDTVNGNKNSFLLGGRSGCDHSQEEEKNLQPTIRRLRIKSNGLGKQSSFMSSNLKPVLAEDIRKSENDLVSRSPAEFEQKVNSPTTEDDEGEGTSGQSTEHSEWENRSGSLETCTDKYTKISSSDDSRKPHVNSSTKMYSSVYKRSRSSRVAKKHEGDIRRLEESTSDAHKQSKNVKMDSGIASTGDVRRTRSMSTRAVKEDLVFHDQLFGNESKSTSRMAVGLRSSRNRRENYNVNMRLLDKRKFHQPIRKMSWLMLLEHEESYRYIPQKGDEVVYLRQGHEEYIKSFPLPETVPSKLFKGILKAVEFCKVRELDYSYLPGSGESCCKLTLEFIDSSSCVFRKTFKLTLPELDTFPDFLVEKTRYEAAIERNWTCRDKCQVWWRNPEGNCGSWWEGRISAVKPKSPEFPESPWERYLIHYKNDRSPDPHSHSPWELHDADSRWEHPHIEEESRDKLLSHLVEMEQALARSQDYYGIQKLNQVAEKSDFMNRFPVPLSLEVIKRRLENNYYRNLEAVEHDASVVLSNADSYFGRSGGMGSKIRRLSDWIKQTFLSL